MSSKLSAHLISAFTALYLLEPCRGPVITPTSYPEQVALHQSAETGLHLSQDSLSLELCVKLYHLRDNTWTHSVGGLWTQATMLPTRAGVASIFWKPLNERCISMMSKFRGGDVHMKRSGVMLSAISLPSLLTVALYVDFLPPAIEWLSGTKQQTHSL